MHRLVTGERVSVWLFRNPGPGNLPELIWSLPGPLLDTLMSADSLQPVSMLLVEEYFDGEDDRFLPLLREIRE